MSYPINLVTGSYGSNHVTSADDGSLFAAIMGRGQYVLEGFDHEIVDNNTIRIKSGDLLINGRHAKINHGGSVNAAIENGTAGMNRIDLIVVTYRNSGGVESADIDVLKGTATTGSAQVPSYTPGDILNDDSVVQMPLFRVNITGINITSVDVLYKRTNPVQEMYNMIIPPVGWIEYNETGINPSNRYPGTVWELVGKGAVDVCVDSADESLKRAGTIVGSNTSTLVSGNLPKHTHGIGNHTHETLPSGAIRTTVAGAHNHGGYYKKIGASGTSLGVFHHGKTATDIVNGWNYGANFTDTVLGHLHEVIVPALKTGNPAAGGITDVNADGAASPFSVMQKSYLVYRWKRTK